MPRLRHRDGQARGRRLHDLPQPLRLPGPVLPARQALRQQGRDGHRRPRREAGAALPRGGPDRRRRRHLRPRRGAAGRARGLRRDLRPQPARGDRRLARAALQTRPLRARPARRRLRHRRGAGRCTSARSTRCTRADPEQIEEVEGVGPIMAVQIAESLADERTGS